MQTTANGAREPVPGFCFAVESFRSPAMALIKSAILIRPALASAPSPQERGIIVADHYGFVDTLFFERQAAASEQRPQSLAREEKKRPWAIGLPGFNGLPRGHFTMSFLAS